MRVSSQRGGFGGLLDGLPGPLVRYILGYVLFLLAFLIGAVVAVARLSFEDVGTGVLWIVGIAVVFSALVAFPVVALTERFAAASIDKGEVWARWHYTDVDRQRIAGARLAPQDAAFSLGGWIPGCLAIVFVVIVFALNDLLLAGLLLGGGILLIAGVVSLPLYRRHRRRARLHSNGLREVTVGPVGLNMDGERLTFTKAGLVLQRVAYQPGPPASIAFTSNYYRIVRGRRITVGHEQVFHLPVPAGREDEAAALVERFERVLADTNERRGADDASYIAQRRA